jgi:serine/threonine protein kinase
MVYLERKGIVHRDLASRNLLVTQDINVKVSDFGLSRDNMYSADSTSPLPIRWSAPEVLLQQPATHKSDVFSFGILMWEVYHFGESPYVVMSNQEVKNFVIDPSNKIKNQLPKSNNCSKEIDTLMQRCWAYDPNVRPSFKEILDELEKKYVESGGQKDVNKARSATATKLADSQYGVQTM